MLHLAAQRGGGKGLAQLGGHDLRGGPSAGPRRRWPVPPKMRCLRLTERHGHPAASSRRLGIEDEHGRGRGIALSRLFGPHAEVGAKAEEVDGPAGAKDIQRGSCESCGRRVSIFKSRFQNRRRWLKSCQLIFDLGVVQRGRRALIFLLGPFGCEGT